ncbi:MAG: electron transfer flavoprotein subunit alpha/FixB family protein [Actinomycetota bacterium]
MEGELNGGSGVMVFAQCSGEKGMTRLAGELAGLGMGLAKDLGEDATVVVCGPGAERAVDDLAGLGMRTCLVEGAEAVAGDGCVPAILAGPLCLRERPRLVMYGHVPPGDEEAVRLAYLLGAGVTSDCTAIEVCDEREIVLSKPVYGGNVVARFNPESYPHVVTVRPHVGVAPEPGTSVAGEIVRLEASDLLPDGDAAACPGATLVSREQVPSNGVCLEEAGVVVAGGRGMGGREGFESLEKLAGLLGGAVGASRPPCDSGWADSASQVGITGKIVAPDIYIAVAISGSTQHLSGMSDAGTIIAVNRDPDAYIFKVSDYGVTGDWKEVLPAFTARLAEMKRQEG